MNLISNKDLDELAFEYCSTKVKLELKGEFLIDVVDSAVEWNPTFLRYVHEADLLIWKKLGAFELIVDGDDQPIGFSNPMVEKGSEKTSITDKEATQVISGNPIFQGQRVELTGSSIESNGVYLCTVKVWQADEEELRYRIRINPSSKEIISAIPVSEAEHE